LKTSSNASIFSSGIRPAIDDYLALKAAEVRNYGDFWSASSAGYCQRKLIFERLGVPPVSKEGDERKTRVFEAGHIFHEWVQRITKDAGLSIAQEVELQDDELMVRGHIDDLILVGKPSSDIKPDIQPGTKDGFIETKPHPNIVNQLDNSHLILYDYKTQHSNAFTWQKGRPASYFHRMQVGTYMYMIRKGDAEFTKRGEVPELTEARILKISKDDLRMDENQILYTPELEQEVLAYWISLNEHWAERKLPPCSCADHESGFMAREKFNPYFFNGEPCSIELYKRFKKEQADVNIPTA
jgi:hypothetical protein